VEEGFSTLDAIPLEDPPPSSNGNHRNKHKTEGFITSTGRPKIYVFTVSSTFALLSGLKLKCD